MNSDHKLMVRQISVLRQCKDTIWHGAIWGLARQDMASDFTCKENRQKVFKQASLKRSLPKPSFYLVQGVP